MNIERARIREVKGVKWEDEIDREIVRASKRIVRKLERRRRGKARR